MPSAPSAQMQTVMNQPDSGDNKYSLPGQKNKVSAIEFQAAIDKYEEKFPSDLLHIVSPKAYDTNQDFSSILVYKCIGAYRGDEYCIKCPLRKACITRR